MFTFMIYTLFTNALHTKVDNLHQQYSTFTASQSDLTALTTAEQLISGALFLSPLTKHLNKLAILVSPNAQDTNIELIYLNPIILDTARELALPFIALIICLFTTFLIASNSQREKHRHAVNQLCKKTDNLIAVFSDKNEVPQEHPATIRLSLALDFLLSKVNDYQAHSKRNADCDKLTQLVNRHCFLEHINQRINFNAKEPAYRSGLLFIDLDGFKQVNDSFGHSFGDEVLIQVAERLKTVVRSQNLSFPDSPQGLELNLARLGGDEFTLFIEHLDSPHLAVEVAQQVLKELERDFILGNKTIKISASVGIAVYPDSANSPETLVQMADVAMYRAKVDGRGIYRIYSKEMSNTLRRYHYLLEEMRIALTTNSFYLTFQPIVHVEGCAISYFEALVRWQHPVEGIITPTEFIPIAEDSNQILQLGDWILFEACRQMSAWYNAGMNKTQISVNVSNIQLKHRSIYRWVMDTLKKTGLPPSALMLEITESCFIDISSEIISELERLRQEGVCIAIDDFGTGFSSLAILATLPVDVLKIDRMFITQATQNPKHSKILKSIVELSQRLNLKVVAEGIEDVNQLELLKSLGVVYIQGYLFSRPVSPVSVGEKVLNQNIGHLAHNGTGVWDMAPEKAKV
ncbi:bifunctional diguanylate cyclase/phosphodiesterase [Psychrobium sp. 1_MG-2023]|uniref:putative bifunctional diguanylate cyclase/phosphodiesterase n=1 Tax=Psychrobium sp. 1_MG-2023 TaxID=3062624 RepID=UPI000C3311C6|nr:EAL domain-containing protein [Psychrobium sp. 1_MG-2023]MDP2562744.1 EAL domain-containing protein [Psychrobium sp. 1_MG-2023]PKF54261.1 GGDEF-domain containing protein [Alteromonadales bacterium alter-6D02]